MTVTIHELLRFAVGKGASDLHLSSGLKPTIRVDGELLRLDNEVQRARDIYAVLNDLLDANQRAYFKQNHELDFAFEIPDVSRFRVNVFQQLRGPSIAFRAINTEASTLDSIGAPPIFTQLMSKRKGLILVTGPTGSGKSTTLSAMVDYINESRPSHIISIEDPIEYIHYSKNSIINQREVGAHTHSFANALKSALREDPDVILVGEMRDRETIQLALTAAETGHLVLSTLHTSSAIKATDRIIDSFEAADKAMVRAMLSESLEAVIGQTLVKKRDSGRHAVWEVLIGTPAVRNLIRENKIPQIQSIMETSQKSGMQTIKQAAEELVRRKIVSKQQVEHLIKRPHADH